MHGQDGCGCGHAHGETMMETAPPTPQTVTSETQMEGGCGDGCGCGSGSPFTQVETGILQGFLSGLYASTLSREKLTEYLDTMSKADGSEFQGPATFLAGALEATPADSPKPVHVALLETVTGDSV